MTISIGSDHAGYALKQRLIQYMIEKGIQVIDRGTDSEAPADYPDHVHPVAEDVENGEANFGVVLCGSGNGAAMTANKHQPIRAALCWTEEIARLARKHNNANVLALPARFIQPEEALRIFDVFITTSFDGGRHLRRILKIPLVPLEE